jgi:hypothetical protein
MTVAEFIEHLKTLEQDRNIWVFYDYPCDAFEPTPLSRANKEAARIFNEYGVKEGDYVIDAG